MKRCRDMNTLLKMSALAGALALAAGPAAALDVYLAAKPFTKNLPVSGGGTEPVPMWGYVEDTGGLDGDGAPVDHCYLITGTGPLAFQARRDCVNALPDPMIPGPRIDVVDRADPDGLRIFLTNGLPVPTSIIIPGQKLPFTTNATNGPTWDIGPPGSRTSETQRMRSYGVETPASGGSAQYIWNNTRQNALERSGTFMYHSGTLPQLQVYMGLYGAVAFDAAPGVVYDGAPAVTYDNDVVLFYSDVDPVHNAAVNAGAPGYTPIHYNAQWFLVNGEPYVAGMDDIPAGSPGETTLLRFLSAASETHVPTLQGMHMSIHAEDGFRYNWQTGDLIGNFAPREQYTVMLPPLKTYDATIVVPDIAPPATEGRYAVYDGNGYMTNPSNPNAFNQADEIGGMLRFLAVAPNQPPEALADSYSTDEDVALVVDAAAGVLANDTDPESDPLTATLGTTSTNGTLVLNTDGSFTYTPNADFNGSDSFTYVANDGTSDSAEATVTITVNPVNDVPVANDDSATTAFETPLSGIDVLANDTDADVGDTLSISAFDATSANGGTVDCTSTCDYTPGTGFSGDDTFTYTVSDGNGGTDTAMVTVTVEAAPQPVVTLYFSTVAGGSGGSVVGVPAPWDDADIYTSDTTGTYGRFIDANLAPVNLPGAADVDGLHVVDADTFYVSFNGNAGTTVPGLGVVQDEDVVLYDAGNWSMYFQGSTCGLDASDGRDIDAISIEGGTLYFSTVAGGSGGSVVGVPGPWDDADVYTWAEGATSCGRVLDASAVSLPGNADIDGLTVKGGTYYMSFLGATTAQTTVVPGLGPVNDEAVVSFGGTSWALYFDGTGLSTSNGQDVDAVHVP